MLGDFRETVVQFHDLFRRTPPAQLLSDDRLPQQKFLHTDASKRTATNSQPLKGQHFVRWCFADAGTAQAFAAEFGGTALMPEHDLLALVEWGKRNVQGG
jgi:hypothetical protein